MKCKYCNKMSGRKHENFCPFNPTNTRLISLYLRDYVVNNSIFNKGFKPFPTISDLDTFLKRNKIMRVNTIRRHYVDEVTKLEDILTEIIGNFVQYDKDREFPIFVLYIYDAYCFLSMEEYEKEYKIAMNIEDSDGKISYVQGNLFEEGEDKEWL